MIKYILMSVVLFFITGCENCDDEVNNLLSDFEKGLIPFTAATTKNFTTNNSETVTGAYSKKENKIEDLDFGDDEDCTATNVESENSILTLSNSEIKISINIRRSRSNKLVFVMGLSNNNNSIFTLVECDDIGVVDDIESLEQSITIQSFQFTNVYVFNSCSENSTINRILYSATNGVEFIEYANGDYLKLEI